jgi:hypothetical protein
MMRGVSVELPDAAATKLSGLTLARDAALDAANAAAQRWNNLPRDAPAGQRDALARQRDEQQARQRAHAGLLGRVNQFLMELRGVALAPAPPLTVVPLAGEKLHDAVERLRGEIAATKLELAGVRSAPLPQADQREIVAQWVMQRARAGRPSVDVLPNGTARIGWSEGATAPALLAWIDPQRLIDALVGELPEARGAISAQERNSAASRLADQLDALERQEAALLEYAHENGIEILPRVDMSASAFLGVVITPTPAQQVA